MRLAVTMLTLVGMSLAAAAGEPTISEMLKEAEAMAVKPPEPGQPGAVDTGLKDSDYVKKMKNRLETELFSMVTSMKQRNDSHGLGYVYFDIQRYQDALGYFTNQLRNERDWRVERGYAHGDLAKVYTVLGQEKLAKDAAEEFGKRVSDPHMLDQQKRLVTWMEKFEGNKAAAEKLIQKAAADPKDADSRWRLLDMYRYDYPRKLDEMVGLMRFREAYPDHRQVKSGECEWRLMEAFWRFGIRDEALKLAEAFRQRYPEHGCTTGGEASFRLGGYYEGLQRYAQALECYKDVGARYPKHWSQRKKNDEPSYIERKIFDMTKADSGRR
jgi:tetratricopeptide (TPR) repeat protein